jgi:MFS family permease
MDLSSLGVSVLNWGLLVSTFGAAMIATEAAWGFVSDRIGKEVVLMIGMLSVSVIAPSYTMTAWIPLFFVLQFLRGALGVAGGPASRALLSDIAPANRMGSSMSMWYTTSTIGQMVGSYLGAYIASATSFAYSLYFCAFSSMAGLILVFFRLRGASAPTKIARGSLSLQHVEKILTMRPLHIAFALAMILMAENTLVTAFLPIFAVRTVGASPTEVGLSMAVFNAVCFAVTLLLARLSDRFGRLQAAILGLTFSFVADLSYVLAASLPQLLLSTAGVAMGYALTGPSLLAFLADITGKEERGAVMGVYGAFEDIGVMIGPLLYGFAWNNLGLTSIFYIGSTLGVLGVILASAQLFPKRPH